MTPCYLISKILQAHEFSKYKITEISIERIYLYIYLYLTMKIFADLFSLDLTTTGNYFSREARWWCS